MRILLVEDEPLLRRMLERVIRSFFVNVETAENGEEGYRLFRNHYPDLVVTDLTMPGMDGLEMLRRIRRECERVPIVILSAYSDREKMLQAIEIGVRKYLIKPFDPEDLLMQLRKISREIAERERIGLGLGFVFDRHAELLFRQEHRVLLSPLERRFLSVLAERPGRVVSAEYLCRKLWEDGEVSAQRLRALAASVRRKSDRRLIETVRGEGYRLSCLTL